MIAFFWSYGYDLKWFEFWALLEFRKFEEFSECFEHFENWLVALGAYYRAILDSILLSLVYFKNLECQFWCKKSTTLYTGAENYWNDVFFSQSIAIKIIEVEKGSHSNFPFTHLCTICTWVWQVHFFISIVLVSLILQLFFYSLVFLPLMDFWVP